MELVYPPVLVLARTVIRAMAYDVMTVSSNNIPRRGGAVLASNHIGYLDFVFTGYAALEQERRVRFLAKKEIWNNKVAAMLMNGMHHIPVDRKAAPGDAYKAAEEALESGELIGMFPESTISTSFVPKKGKTGSARLAQSAGVPLIPIALWGTQRILTKGRPRNYQRNIPIHIVVGDPIPTSPDDDPVALTEELMGEIRSLLKKAQDEYPDTPSGPGDRWWLPAHLGGTAPTPDEAER
ncbi:MAG: lysophospholipid acyltransferase family protein [Actinomycetota bacterium]